MFAHSDFDSAKQTVLRICTCPTTIEASCKILLNSTQWFVRNRLDKIWLPTDQPTDRHSDSYIPPKNLVFWGYNYMNSFVSDYIRIIYILGGNFFYKSEHNNKMNVYLQVGFFTIHKQAQCNNDPKEYDIY